MHTSELLPQWLRKVLPKIHDKRVESLSVAAGAALRGGRLTVTGLGRSIGGAIRDKHNIKRADRLLSNSHLQSEIKEIYRALCEEIIGGIERPIIAIDWSALDQRGNFAVLRAAVTIEGRTLTLYEEVHDAASKEKRLTHTDFLYTLKDILPPGTRPILVTDSGFRKPWFKVVKRINWDFVGRVRNANRVKLNNKSILSSFLYTKATTTPHYLGAALLTEHNPLECNLILYKAKPKKRIKKNKLGKRARGDDNPRYEKGAKDPWLLATSLDVEATEIVRIYSTRMQIEESFRDLKSTRCGLGLEQHRTYKKERLAVMLLIGAIATTFAWLLGKASEIAGFHRQLQANTLTKQRVLSYFFLGINIFKKLLSKINIKLFTTAQQSLKENIKTLSYV